MTNVAIPYTFTPNTTIQSAQVNANFQALQVALNTNTRAILTAPTTFYIAPTGSDANTGVNPSAPAATVNHIISLLHQSVDANDQIITISCANGSYTQDTLIRGISLGQYFESQLQIVGNPGAPSLVTFVGSPCFQLNSNAMVELNGITLQGSSDCLISAGGSSLLFQNVIFTSAVGAHMRALRGGQIVSIGNYTIAGNANFHVQSQGGGASVILEGIHNLDSPPPPNQPVINLTGTPAWGTGFFSVGSGGTLFCTAQFSGAATGSRGAAFANGVVQTGGNPNATTTYFPGSVNPTMATGGQIV